jgi:tetratricopeptide (TPR) repeat protein
MPNIPRIFITKFIIFFLTFSQSFNCQANTDRLNLADSLFTQRSYQESLSIYEDLLQNQGVYSPAMLIKMAYISEGMGDYPKATLYLSKYYDFNPSPRITDKIKSLTQQPNLQGYLLTDRQQFFKILTDQQAEITSVLSLLLVISLILVLVYRKKANHPKYLIPSFVLIFLVFISNNFLKGPERGIIMKNPTLIMDQPTAAGNLIRTVNVGHRVTIKSKKDIWYEIEWNNQKAYIKQENLSKI